jgi:hypothetical protein
MTDAERMAKWLAELNEFERQCKVEEEVSRQADEEIQRVNEKINRISKGGPVYTDMAAVNALIAELKEPRTRRDEAENKYQISRDNFLATKSKIELYRSNRYPPPRVAARRFAMNHSGLLLAVIIFGLLAAALIFHNIIVAPCRATTTWHTVTDNLGRPYQTGYKDSGEWCLWVRRTFN